MMDLDQKIAHTGLATCSLQNTLMHDLLEKKIKQTFSRISNKQLSDLDEFHKTVKVERINDYRLEIAAELNKRSYASDLIYEHTKEYITKLLGPDIAIQKNVGLSIQMPDDSGSLLHIHSDVYDSDCSPYELVIWVPLVKCYESKSMFYLPLDKSDKLNDYINLSTSLRENLESPKEVNEFLRYLNIEPPEFAIFSHSIWHGNKVNKTNETRFSLNVRVKNLFTPYRGKKLGDFFKIANLSPLAKMATEIESLIDE